MVDKFVGVFSILVFSFFYSVSVQAIPCDSRFPGQGLTGSQVCLNGAPGDSTLGFGGDYAFDLNAGSYFGFNDWVFLQKQNTRVPPDPLFETAYDAGLNVTPFVNLIMGTWSIFDSAWADWDDLTIVLQSDISGENQIFWSAYLLQEGATFGLWRTGGKPLVSVSIFGRRMVVPVPEPMTLEIFGLGLLGIALIKRNGQRLTNVA